MHDTLDYLGHEPVHRSYHHGEMTFSIDYAWTENFILPLSHDEVVHGKGSLLASMPGDDWNKAAGVRSLLAFMWAHPGKQMLFMGGEFGQEGGVERATGRWSGTLLDQPLHSGVLHLVSDLNAHYRSTPALYWRGQPRPRASSGSMPATSPATRSGSCGSARTARRWPASPTSPASPHDDYRVGLPLDRHVAGGHQHRQRDLRRFRGRQPRRGRGRGGGVARSTRFGAAAAPAGWRRVARTGVTVPSCEAP